ncbi:hypothetical protein MSPP1_002426 [Malassezia sp. CBS 17886]|nr:hypothetical protein MSPP1_002426 [Malassezia sp. CBS 17886]
MDPSVASVGEAAQRFDVLRATTQAILQERMRLGHEIAMSSDAAEPAFGRAFPYFARDRVIVKHMHTMMSELEKEQKEHAQNGAGEDAAWDAMDARAASVRGLADLLAQTNQELNDPRGLAMLRELRESHPSVFRAMSRTPQPHTPQPGTPANAVDSLPVERLSRGRSEMPVSAAAYPPDDRSAAVQLSAQNAAMASQDNHLDYLGTSIGRQHQLSLQMNEELELQSGLLQDFNADADRTGLHLGGATSRLEQVRRSMRDQGSTWMIFVLIIVLVLLIVLFK